MARGKQLGWKICRWCGDKAAEVREDKKGAPYAVCYECPDGVSQDFTYGRPQRLAVFVKEGFRPIDPANVPAWAAPAAPAKPAPAAPAKAADPAPAPVKKKTSGLLIGGDGE